MSDKQTREIRLRSFGGRMSVDSSGLIELKQMIESVVSLGQEATIKISKYGDAKVEVRMPRDEADNEGTALDTDSLDLNAGGTNSISYTPEAKGPG